MENPNRMYDFTSLDTFLKCRKKFFYRMRKHLEPKTVAPALEFGKAIHTGLQHLHLQIKEDGDRKKGLARAILAFSQEFKDREGEDLRTVENGIQLLRGYEEVYRNDPFKVIAVEVGFAVPIHDPQGGEVILCGRLDTLVDWEGALYVLENKTTSRLSKNYFLQYDLNMQVDGYVYGAAESTGRKCIGAIINALEVWKPVQRQTAKTKKLEEHYARDPKDRSDLEIREFLSDVPRIVRDIEECDRRDDGTGTAFYRNKAACMDYNTKCPYWDICKYGWNEKIVGRDYNISKWVPWTADHKEEKKSEV